MHRNHFRSLALAAVALAGFLTTGEAFAFEANCNAAPNRASQLRCLQGQAQIYRQQSQYYNDIARQQYRQHQQVGRALRRAPLIGPYAAPAWNAPRHYNNYRNGR